MCAAFMGLLRRVLSDDAALASVPCLANHFAVIPERISLCYPRDHRYKPEELWFSQRLAANQMAVSRLCPFLCRRRQLLEVFASNALN